MNKNYKSSRYNIFVNLNNEILIFNSLTGALAKITKDYFGIIDILNKKRFNKNELSSEIFDFMLKNGFIIEETFDETKFLRFLNLMFKFQNNSLHLTILPTLGCNFSCVYCYQNEIKYDNENKWIKMSKEVAENIALFVEKKIKKENIKNFTVAWYGGEPLLCMEIIESLSNKFIEICNSENVKYSASMVTNGYLLTPEKVKILEKLKVSSVQVTIDGLKNTHDKRRPLKGGKGTFDKIIENLKYINNSSHNVKVTLRANIDRSNLNEIFNLMEFISKNFKKDKIYFYSSPVLNIEKSGSSCYDVKKLCFTWKEVAYINLDLFDRARELGLIQGEKIHRFVQAAGGYCGAISISAYAIDPNGNLYKCWLEVGETDKKVGQIGKGGDLILDFSNFFKWVMFDPLDFQKCKNCKLLPFCVGHCYYYTVTEGTPRCHPLKYSLKGWLQRVYNIKKHKRVQSPVRI